MFLFLSLRVNVAKTTLDCELPVIVLENYISLLEKTVVCTNCKG